MYLKINWSVKMFDIGRVWELLAPGYGHLAASCFSTHNLHILNEMPSLEFIYRSQAPVIDIFLQRMWDKKCIT